MDMFVSEYGRAIVTVVAGALMIALMVVFKDYLGSFISAWIDTVL